MYSVDLPGHGDTRWPEGNVLSPIALAAAIRQIANRHGVKKVSLLGFSLGGRVALALLAAAPYLFDNAVLAAPDGLVFNPTYYVVTRTAPGKRIFNSLLTDPTKHIKFLHMLKQRGWLPESRYRFMEQYLSSKWSRNLLRESWPPLRDCVTPQSRIHKAVQKAGIRLHLFMGINDYVIPLEDAWKLVAGNSHVVLHKLNTGHRIMADEGALQQMAEILKSGGQ